MQRATRTEDNAIAHADAFEDVADSLWTVHSALNSASKPRPAVASAVDVLTSGSLTTIPRVLTSAIGIKSDETRPEKRILLASEVSEVTQQRACSTPQSLLRTSKPNVSSPGSVSPSVTERLGIATRNCVRESLLHLGALRVLSWRSGIADVCVKVGMRNLWSADVSLDSLDPDTAVLRVHAVNIAVAHDVDAAGRHQLDVLGNAYPQQMPESQATPSQETLLRRMADDRMSAALQAARGISKPQTNVNATSVMLCALRDMMIDDVCAPLAMDYLRAQALALSNGRWKNFIRVEAASGETPRAVPLTIHYWPEHRKPALMRLHEFRSYSTKSTTPVSAGNAKDSAKPQAQSNVEDPNERKPECVRCLHEPSLPSAVELGGTSSAIELCMNRINLEDYILDCIRLRSCARLKNLSQAFVKKRVQLRVHPSCIVLCNSGYTNGNDGSGDFTNIEDVLRIHFGGVGQTGVEVKIFNMTGGIRIRPYGAAALSLPVQRVKDCDLWTGTKHLKSRHEEESAVIKAFEAVRARVKLNASARSVCALDIGVSNTLPPGTASVAATASPDRAASQLVPPFAPLERRAPRRFLTLSPPPQAKDLLSTVQNGTSLHVHSRSRGSRTSDRGGPTKRPRLTYATTSDALVFIQESSFAGEDWQVEAPGSGRRESGSKQLLTETDCIDRYSGTSAAAAAWAVTREVVERRLRRDSLLRAFVHANVASTAQMHHMKTTEDGDLHLDSASRVLLKVKCEPLPVRRAELLLRGYDAWQVRLSLLPSIFDSTDGVTPSQEDGSPSKSTRGGGNLWSVGVACTGSHLTFTYPSANSASVRSFFRDLTRARTAAALARGVPPSRFYRVLRRSPVRIVVGIGPYDRLTNDAGGTQSAQETHPKPLYTATVEYVYSKGNSGGFSLSFSPSNETMERLAPYIEEALDASGGQVGGILAGLLERACPVAAAAESAVRERGSGRIRFVTALRVRVVFAGVHKTIVKNNSQHRADGQLQANPEGQTGHVVHAVDVDARGGSGLVTVIDVGRATAVMIQQGFAQRTGSSSGGGSNRRNDFVSLPKWDEIVARLTRDGFAEAQRAGSTVVLKMEMLERFLSDLVTSAGSSENT